MGRVFGGLATIGSAIAKKKKRVDSSAWIAAEKIRKEKEAKRKALKEASENVKGK